MKKSNIVLIVFLFCTNLIASTPKNGEQVFRAYCWGCHHQTSMAFGPSFAQIAKSRTKEQIITHIMAPKSDYKQLGYKRSVMPGFGETLKQKELDLIVKFIYSCKNMK